MLRKNLRGLIFPVCNIVIQSGEIINKYYKTKIKISHKLDKSPVTQADIESNEKIINLLGKIDKDIPVLSEERLIDWSIRKNWKTYWLIDPLDGTKEFINKKDEFTINIALIHNNLPVLGVIYAPALSLLYFAYKDGGSFKVKIENNKMHKNYLDDAFKLQVSSKSKKNTLKIICSRSHSNDENKKWLNQNIKKYEIIKKGSSLKFCVLAEKKADVYPRFIPSSEWDIAAGHIILTEAGGRIKTLNNEEIVYNLKENVINPYFIASCKIDL